MICPLCNEQLQPYEDYISKKYMVDRKEWTCPTMAQFPEGGHGLTHYRFATGSVKEAPYRTRIVFVLPYRIIEEEGRFQISKRYENLPSDEPDEDYIAWRWEEIVSVPSFPITSEKQLRDKIRTYAVFS